MYKYNTQIYLQGNIRVLTHKSRSKNVIIHHLVSRISTKICKILLIASHAQVVARKFVFYRCRE